jgi:hypothetical protein
MSVDQPRNVNVFEGPRETAIPSDAGSLLGLRASDWMLLFAGIAAAAAVILFV